MRQNFGWGHIQPNFGYDRLDWIRPYFGRGLFNWICSIFDRGWLCWVLTRNDSAEFKSVPTRLNRQPGLTRLDLGFGQVHPIFQTNPTKNLEWKLGLDILDFSYLKMWIQRINILSKKIIKCRSCWNPDLIKWIFNEMDLKWIGLEQKLIEFH